MFLKIKLLSITIFGAGLLLVFLCLGSQNMENRHSINFLTVETVKLPKGFLVGSSFIIGFLLGGTTGSLSSDIEIKDET